MWYENGHYEGLVGEPDNRSDNESMESKGEGSDRKGGPNHEVIKPKV